MKIALGLHAALTAAVKYKRRLGTSTAVAWLWLFTTNWAFAGLVEPNYFDAIGHFRRTLEVSKAYSGLDPDGRDIALLGAAAWFLNFQCKEPPVSKDGKTFLIPMEILAALT
jgi:hypothetical protein